MADLNNYDYSYLLGKIKIKGLTQSELADKIGIHPSTLNQKLNNKSEFSQEEMKNICHVLEIPLEYITSYFFTQ